MYFWEIKKEYYKNIALIDPANNVTLTYEDIDKISSETAGVLGPGKKLAFLFCQNDYSSVLYYTALLKAGHAVLLLDNKLNDEIKSKLIDLYRPGLIFAPEGSLYSGYTKNEITDDLSYHSARYAEDDKIYPGLAVLLSTSGTTGSPKLVKLSYENVEANAESITEYLSIGSDQRAITSLPMSYSYGLSVINTHLLAGASLLLTDKSFVFRDFWYLFDKYRCTSFSGVPYSYELLKKTNFEKMDLPSLQTMTQAGGRLSLELVKYFHELAGKKGFKFFVMYGQTEATARISYVPPELLPEKVGSIGVSIPGGKIKIYSEGEEVKTPGVHGELIYEGKNVMLGYAESAEDLEKGDENKGVLHTGDLAYRDSDGFFYITGRLKRFIKIFGLRLNLDDVEKMIESHFGIFNACSGTDDRLNILLDTADVAAIDDIRLKVAVYYKIKVSVITVRLAEKMPVTDSGKKDYSAISKLF